MSKNPLGIGIQDIVAGAVHKVIVAALPHHHAIRKEETLKGLGEAAEPHYEWSTNLFGYCLDNDLVHDLLKPLFRLMAGR